ncbi:MAG TPA: carboxypeptidase regulatory-like domain-containing protein [Gemmatimonadaceae bacterium]|jgi:hypothetical protein|nr:carboxypeptidase regulatory-like domain-containing protein [Gemmatimonadaceae bacterium]
MRTHLLLGLALLAHVLHAQVTDTARPHSSAIISGNVRDSIAHTPLGGSTVQLIAAENQASFARTAVADSLGRFAIADVPDGRYVLGFFHPLLDSLGVEPPTREVRIEGQQSVHVDLATPSAVRLRTTICGPNAASDSIGLIVGNVHDARDGTPVAHASVFGEWTELSVVRGGLVRSVPRLTAVTGDNGWFAMCNVPSAGSMTLMAARGGDSTDILEVQVPATGFLRRELYLGGAQTVVVADTTKRSDTLTLAPRRIRHGNGRLSGTVVSAVDNRPLGNAAVSIVDGPTARADDQGAWTITDAPVGSRMLEVRAVGFYPLKRPVNIIVGAPPVRITLSTLEAVLDTVRITASPFHGRDINEFYQRRKRGIGKFLTPDDIAKRGVIATSDVFRTVPGVHLERNGGGGDTIYMRGAFGWCVPTVYINGGGMDIGPAEIDDFVSPKQVAGIEIYHEDVPPQFQRGISGCGSIVIWTK